MQGERSERFIRTTASLFSLTPTLFFLEKSRSTCIRCALPCANCGASKPHYRILFTLICGMTTLSLPNSIPQPENLASLPHLPSDEGGPVFAEPWQAQVFALAVRLSAQGHFTWKEWAAALAAELAAALERDEADDGTEYYHHWVAALEKLVASKGLADEPELYERKEAW